METTIVIVIVGVAAFFAARRFYRTFKKGESSCGCGSSSCSSTRPSTKNKG